MGFFDQFDIEPPEEVPFFPASNKDEEIEVRSRSPKPDELSLGYAIGWDKGHKVSQLVAVPQSDRITHFYVIGASGTGKTKFLEHLIQQDIKNGVGFGIIDPHGDLTQRVKELLAFVAERKGGMKERVVLIDPTDKEYTICFNPLALTEGYAASRQAEELVEIFKRIWVKDWGMRMEDILKNTLIALIENNLTLYEVPTFLTNNAFRAKFVPNIKNDLCREYFQNEFDVLNQKTRTEWTTSTLNKVRQFLLNEAIRDIFLSTKSSFNFREVMDSGKILLVRLPKGLLGDENSDLLGSLILSKIQMAAFSRADTPEDKRVPFYLYIDEFQNFAAKNFDYILDEARKYKLALTLAHQNLSQVPEKLKSSLLNCPLQAYFRVSRDDAEVVAKEMFVGMSGEPQPWEFYFQKIQKLEPRNCYVKNKHGGGVALIVIPEADWREKTLGELFGEDEDFSFFAVETGNIGQHYLRERKMVVEEHRARMQKVLAGEQESEDFFQPI